MDLYRVAAGPQDIIGASSGRLGQHAKGFSLKMDPLVSIVVPCYNAAPWLGGTIASVRAQTWRRFEIILVDDGSSDGSGEIADRLAGPDMQVVHQRNQGQCSALNRGLERAQGDFVNYLDADDLLAPDKIAVQLARLRDLPADWIASGAWARFQTDAAQAAFTPERVWADLPPVDWLVTSWEGGGMMHGAAWLCPRAVVKAAGAWDESLTLINDLDYFPRLLLAGKGVAFCGGARTYYRSNVTGSLSRSTSRAAWESAFKATELSAALLLAREDSPRARHACATNLQRLVHSAYPFVPDLVRSAEKRIAALGGSELVPGGGGAFRVLARMLGWKLARRAQVMGRSVLKGDRT
jgi:glycosyltransferase involved in cell wall biosynthesis